MSNISVDILMEHQFSEDGRACTCGQMYYTFPFPDRMTVREHATHQYIQLNRYLRIGHRREWDD